LIIALIFVASVTGLLVYMMIDQNKPEIAFAVAVLLRLCYLMVSWTQTALIKTYLPIGKNQNLGHKKRWRPIHLLKSNNIA